MSRKQTFKQNRDKPHKAKPYERPKSLFGRIASTVCDYLVPSWLLSFPGGSGTDPLDNPQPSTSRGFECGNFTDKTHKRAALNDSSNCIKESVIPFKETEFPNTDSDSTDVDVTSEVAPRQGDGRRQEDSEFRIPAVLPSWINQNVRQSDSRTRSIATTQGSGGPSRPRRNGSGEAPALVNGDDQSEQSDASASTSGCSSLVPSDQEGKAGQHHPHLGLNISEAALERLKKEFSEKQLLLSQRKEAETRNSSYADKNVPQRNLTRGPIARQFSKPQATVQGKRPSFSLAPFGPSTSMERTNLTNTQNSPFYKGKTVYGGASAHRKLRLTSSPYKAVMHTRSPVRVRPQAEKDDFICMSHTAKHILEALEKAPTPLTDAKKIPQYSNKSRDMLSSFMPASQRWKSNTMVAKVKSSGPPVASIRTPGKTTIARNLEPLVRANMEKLSERRREDENLPIAEKRSRLSADADSLPLATGSGSLKAGGKIRTRINQARHQSAKPDFDDEVLEEPNLPSVALPITNLPKFSFMPSFSDVGSPQSRAPSTSTPLPRSTVAQIGVNVGKFVFSVPKCHALPSSPKSAQTRTSHANPNIQEEGFKFSSPHCSDKALEEGNKLSSDLMFQYERPRSPLSTRSGSLLPVSSKSPSSESKPECASSPLRSSETVDVKPAETLIITGSVMDVLGKNNKTAVSKSSPLLANAVKDETCSKTEKTDSKNSADKPISSTASGFGDRFKSPPGSWECPDCYLQNDASRTKCVACESPKPDRSDANRKISNSDAKLQGFGTQFKLSSDVWECSTCCVRNKNSDLKCVCCEAPKPGSSKPAATFGFGNQFKPPPGSWSCPTCMINNAGSLERCAACETAKPGSAQSNKPSTSNTKLVGFGDKFLSPPSSWECDACMVRNKADSSKCIACETPRIKTSTTADFKQQSTGFKFGIPPKDNNGASATFKFGVPAAASTTFAASPIVSSSTSVVSSNFKFGVPSVPESSSTKDSAFKMPLAAASPSAASIVFGIPAAPPPSDSTPTFESPPAANFEFCSPSTTDASKTATFSFSKAAENSSSKTHDSPAFISSTTSNAPWATLSDAPNATFKKPCVASAPSSVLSPQSSQSESSKPFPSLSQQPISSASRAVIASTSANASVALFQPGQKTEAQGFSNTSLPEKMAAPASSAAPSQALPIVTPFSFAANTSASTFPSTSALSSTASSMIANASLPSSTTASLPLANFTFGFGSVASKSEEATRKTDFSISQPIKQLANPSPAPSTFSFLKNDPPSTAAPTVPATEVRTTAASGSVSSTFKFGAPSSAPAPSGGFLFGASKPEASRSGSGGFQFAFGTSNKTGSEAAPATKEPVFGGFGNQTAATSLPSASASLFGTPTTASSSLSTTPAAPGFGSQSSGIFSFGAPANQPSNAGFPSSATTTAAQNLLFGGTPATASGGFGIGAPAAPAFRQTAPEKKAEGTRFPSGAVPSTGFAASPAPPGVFQFGATQEQPASNPLGPSGGFNFAAANSGGSVSGTGGFSFASSGTPNFNFSQTPGPVSNFTFSATSDNPFNATSTGSSQRRIRKAVRRVGRKPNE